MFPTRVTSSTTAFATPSPKSAPALANSLINDSIGRPRNGSLGLGMPARRTGMCFRFTASSASSHAFCALRLGPAEDEIERPTVGERQHDRIGAAAEQVGRLSEPDQDAVDRAPVRVEGVGDFRDDAVHESAARFGVDVPVGGR